MPKKILGREPAVFFALVASVLLALIQFTNVPEDIAGALNAAVLAGAGFATAATVSAERVLPTLVGLVQAVFAVFLAYGSPVPENTQTGILALIAAVSAFFVRQNVYAPVDIDYENRWEAVRQAGYEAGQDDMVSSYPEPDAPRLGAGAHHHTDVMPSVGDVHEGGRRDQR
jgi:hypothetical protein